LGIIPDYPHPVFFVSVASKGFTESVSLLFATHTERPTSVADKGLREEDGQMQGAGAKDEREGLGENETRT
jgi:hypothetical protein